MSSVAENFDKKERYRNGFPMQTIGIVSCRRGVEAVFIKEKTFYHQKMSSSIKMERICKHKGSRKCYS